MIIIRTFFKDWHEVTEDKAINFIKNKMKDIPDYKNKLEYLNSRYLKGITVQELLKGTKELNNYYEVAKYKAEHSPKTWEENLFDIKENKN